ncbi:unnamed protein product [Schistosoma margrebowiei]|uniref:28S ribosomal protein S28, mitochondrial n=1 Tax=Schistosoma margrebowiei TaxID=48269 RepID=A0AA84ZYB6_9TREM|nr:unnamed protein product [Schistosoma margrebowiei]
MTLRKTYVLSRLIKCLRYKSLISCQRYSCSSANLSNQDPASDPDKLTEFLNKAERSTTEDKDFSDNSQNSVFKTNDDSKSDVGPSSISNFQENSSKKDEFEEKRAVSSFSFVPWTMSLFLKEMDISKLLSERSKSSEKSFHTLLRYSPFIQLGDFRSRELIGVVIDNVDDTDLYIDFGGKFHCVCHQPANQFYPRGSLVRIRLKNPELTDKFMVNTKGVSIFEADAVLLGPYKGRLVRTIPEEEKMVTTSADGVKKQRPSTDEDSVALEHWRLK